MFSNCTDAVQFENIRAGNQSIIPITSYFWNSFRELNFSSSVHCFLIRQLRREPVYKNKKRPSTRLPYTFNIWASFLSITFFGRVPANVSIEFHLLTLLFVETILFPIVVCEADEFECPESGGSCIPSRWVCDIYPDCDDSRADEDETLCQFDDITGENLFSIQATKHFFVVEKYRINKICGFHMA